MSSPVLPLWLTAPLGVVLLLLVAAHLLAMHRAGDRIPPSRRRIRTTNSAVALVTIPLTVYAFSVVTPSQTRPFLLAWLTVMGLLGITLLLASIDMANNARLRQGARDELRTDLADLSARLAALRAEQDDARRDDRHDPDLRLTDDDDNPRNTGPGA